MIVFANAHVVVGNGQDIDTANVVVHHGRIVSVLENPSAPRGEVTIDLEGRTLMPGMIDLHTHMAGGDKTLALDDEAAGWRMNEPLVKGVLDSVDAARVTLNAGITTAREVGTRDFIDVFLRRAQAAGQVEGPRMRVTGPGLAITGGHGAFLLQGHEADGPVEMIKCVRWLVAHGVDWIKAQGADGPQTLGDWCTVQTTAEELDAAFAEARRLGRPTMAHAMGPDAIKNVVEAGGDTIEHGWFMAEETCRLMMERGTYLVPTLGCAIDIINKGPGLMMPWASMMADDEERIFDCHRMAVELGVKIAMGSDCGGNEARVHGDNAEELIYHVGCGMSPAQALVSATLDGAKVLRLDQELGSIEVGKIADLVIIDGDPLSDVELTKSGVVAVVQAGRVIRDDLGMLGEMRLLTTPPRTETATVIKPPSGSLAAYSGTSR